MSSKPKYYRPYLTLDELNELAVCPSLTPKLAHKFHKLLLSARAELTKAAYTAAPKQSLEESLGMGTSASISPEAKRLAAYHKSLAGEELTAEEKELADTYKWEKGLGD